MIVERNPLASELAIKAWTPLKDHQTQIDAWRNTKRFSIIPAGRRCLKKGTLVATPEGPKRIEDLKIGDKVIGWDGKPEITKVTAIHANGIQDTISLSNSNRTYIEATPDHKLWAAGEKGVYKGKPDWNRKEIKDLSKNFRVKKAYCLDLMTGGKSIPFTYILGAMLGDGCCRESKYHQRISDRKSKQEYLSISSPDNNVPERIANLLDTEYKSNADNYTHLIGPLPGINNLIPFYNEWCNGKLSSEKIATWKEVDTWDKETCFAFLAGLFDTGGCFLQKGKKDFCLSIGMLARPVITVVKKIIFKWFQEKPNIYYDKREYKNGAKFKIVSITQNLTVKRITEAIQPYAVRKYSKIFNFRQLLPDTISLKKKKTGKAETFDITVGNKTNLYVLHNGGIVTSNSGKTEIIGKRKMAMRFMLCHDKRYPQFYSPYVDPKFFIGAPTRDQVKRIYWQDMKRLIPKAFMMKPPNESNLIIYGLNGAELHLLGLDKPERMEGSPWDHGTIDEIGNVKPNAWQANIRPSLSDRNGGCDFIGVPEGRNHYYDMWKKAESDTTGQWARFHWVSADILPESEIIAAKAELDELVYSQEYEASFVNFSGVAYYNFDERVNVGNIRQFYDPNKPLVFCFDFNVSPGTATIAQEYGADVFQVPIGQTVTAAIGEVHIPRNSTTPRVCKKLIQDWGEHRGKIICYGDATGGAQGSAKVRGSDWDLIKAELYGYFGRQVAFNVPKANPLERQRINAVNSRFKSTSGNIRMMIDGKHCPQLIRDFEGVILIEGGAGEIDKKADSKLTHLSDGFGYYIHREYPVFKYWGVDDINDAIKDLRVA